MAAAIVAAVTVAVQLARRFKVSQPAGVYDLVFPVIISALVGARLYAVALFWPAYAANPLEIFKVWHGGLAIHGAIAGGALALAWYCRRHRQPLLAWADLIAVVLPLGQAIGRWGNYFNQELFGPPTTLPWGVFIAPPHRPAEFSHVVTFHPTFLYESLLNAGLFLLLAAGYGRWRSAAGRTLGTYFIGYGFIRLLMESLRLDPTPVVLGLRWPVLVSIGLIAAGGWLSFQRRPASARTVGS